MGVNHGPDGVFFQILSFGERSLVLSRGENLVSSTKLGKKSHSELKFDNI